MFVDQDHQSSYEIDAFDDLRLNAFYRKFRSSDDRPQEVTNKNVFSRRLAADPKTDTMIWK